MPNRCWKSPSRATSRRSRARAGIERTLQFLEHTLQLDVRHFAGMAAVALPGAQKSFGFLRALRLDAPFLDTRDEHRRVVGFRSRFSFGGHACSHHRSTNPRISRLFPPKQTAGAAGRPLSILL